MTASAGTAEVIRLRITQRPAIDTEGPYVDDEVDEWARPSFDGSLALATPVRWSGPPPRLRLVDRPRDHAADSGVLQARLWEDEPRRGPTEAPEPAPAADDVSFDPVVTPRPSLPPPGPQAASLVRALLEVLSGDRSLRQLASCTSTAVYDELETQVRRRSARPWAGSLRRILLCEPVPGVAEVTAVISQGARTIAVAMRMEGMDGRWQVTALQLQ